MKQHLATFHKIKRNLEELVFRARTRKRICEYCDNLYDEVAIIFLFNNNGSIIFNFRINTKNI